MSTSPKIHCGWFDDLLGKPAIVTGAARGIGRAVATALTACGCRVLAVDIAEETSWGINPDAPDWLAHRADIRDEGSVAAMVEHCVAELGPPEILMNVAAISRPCLVESMSPAVWRETIDVNLTGVFLCTTAVLPHMIALNRGSIVSFSSLIASTGGASSAHYSAAKAGVEGFCRSLALEVGPQGLRINVVAPGLIDTDMLALMPEAHQKSLVARVPMRRVGCPKDLVGICLFLASDMSSYITGQTIPINGGLYMN